MAVLKIKDDQGNWHPIAANIIERVDGVRKVQFTVELDEESTYLPLTGLTEIPEVLIVSSYDELQRTATSGYGSVDSSYPSYEHIGYANCTMLNVPYFNNNSGTTIAYSEGSAITPRRTMYSSGTINRNYGRYETGNYVGWVHPANATQSQYQAGFIQDVKENGYALDGNGTLCFVVNQIQLSGNKFAADMTYIVTALYDVLDTNTIGTVTLDRTVNSTNVIATV